jgi:hypothetical protein
MDKCQCTFVYHSGRHCPNLVIYHCQECGLNLCHACNAAQHDPELASMVLCHACYRRIRSSEANG